MQLLRQQSQRLIEQGKELVIAQKRECDNFEFLNSKNNITWKFVVFALILILAFVGTLSHLWLSTPKDLELAARLNELTAQNERLQLEISNLFQIIDELKKNYYEKLNNDHKHSSSKNGDKLSPSTKKTISFKQIELPKESVKTSFNCGDDEDVAGFCSALPFSEKATRNQQKIPFNKKSSENYFQTKKNYENLKNKFNSDEERKYKSSESKGRSCKDCKSKYSSERKSKNRKKDSKEIDGNWHDKNMKNREKQRKHKQQQNENVWSIEQAVN